MSLEYVWRMALTNFSLKDNGLALLDSIEKKTSMLMFSDIGRFTNAVIKSNDTFANCYIDDCGYPT